MPLVAAHAEPLLAPRPPDAAAGVLISAALQRPLPSRSAAAGGRHAPPRTTAPRHSGPHGSAALLLLAWLSVAAAQAPTPFALTLSATVTGTSPSVQGVNVGHHHPADGTWLALLQYLGANSVRSFGLGGLGVTGSMLGTIQETAMSSIDPGSGALGALAYPSEISSSSSTSSDAGLTINQVFA